MRYYNNIEEYIADYKRNIQTTNDPIFYSFDIETTKGAIGSYMYCWQFDYFNDFLGHNSIICRKWSQFETLIKFLGQFENIKIAIHNLSYEWAFISHRYKDHIEKVFALEKRKIANFTLYNCKFFDTYILTDMSLLNVAKHYTALRKAKTVDGVSDLDYTVARNSATLLTDEERNYCYLDVEILTEYQQTMYKKGFDKLPITKTGFVRRRIKNSCNTNPNHKALIKRNYPNIDIYKFMMRYVYCGGYNGARPDLIGKTLKSNDMQSVDKKSSYPDSCFEKLPYRFTKVTNIKKAMAHVLDDIENRAFMGVFRVKVTNKLGYTIFSRHKCIWFSDTTKFINGRLQSGEVSIALTELDYITLHRYYNVLEEKPLQLYIAKKDYLPIEILAVIKDCFYLKNNTPKNDVMYMLNKQDLNAVYGYFVQSIFNSELLFDNLTGLIKEDTDFKKEWWKIVSSQYTLPQWGVWVSAQSRYDILSLLYEIVTTTKTFNAYSDTDSLKLVNYSKCKHIIEEYNRKHLERNRKLEKLFNFEEGALGSLGIYENETEEHGGIEKFKTLGCKRYLYQCKDGHIEVAVAGLPKNSFINTCRENKRYNYFKYFDIGFKANKDQSHKLASTYIDEPKSEYIKDKYGNVELMHEFSCVNLDPIEFIIKRTDLVDIIQLLNKRSRIGQTYL